jgi:uncharacterized protein YbaA (DUF1428 family)
MSYVDGFVLPVPKKNLDSYRRLATEASEIWKDHGALEYRECVGEDLDSEGMGITFPRALGVSPDETVVFAWIVYESREHRDQVNEKVMADPRMAEMPGDMPFDVQRMLYGGFETVVEA